MTSAGTASSTSGWVIDESFVAERSLSAHTVEIEGEAVVLDEAQDRLHLLNVTATLVWRCLDGTSTVAAVCSDLSDELGIPFDQVLSDTITVLRVLAREGLIEGGNSGSGFIDGSA